MVYNHTSQPSPSSIAFPSPVRVTLASFFFFLFFFSLPLFSTTLHSVSTRFQFPVNSSGSPSRDRHSSSFSFSAPSVLYSCWKFFETPNFARPSASLFVTSSLSRLASPRPTLLASIYFPASSTFLEILWIVRTASLERYPSFFLISPIFVFQLSPSSLFFSQQFSFYRFSFPSLLSYLPFISACIFLPRRTILSANRKNYPNEFRINSKNSNFHLPPFPLKIRLIEWIDLSRHDRIYLENKVAYIYIN